MSDSRALSLTWDLDSLFPHPSQAGFRETFDRYRKDQEQLAADAERLPILENTASSAQAWSPFFERYEAAETRAADLASFLGCHAAADAGNKLFRQFEAEMSSLDPLRERVTTAVEFALQGLGESELSGFCARTPWLSKNAFFLAERRRNAKLRLPKDQEILAAELGVDGLHAWGRLYDRVSGDLRIAVMEKGTVVEKSPSQVRFDSPERSVRENNFYAADKAWKTVADTCADALNHIAGTRLSLYRRIGLRDHLEVPLHKNRMTRETLQAMWKAVSDRKPVLLGFLKKKAELLGLPALAWYDLTAPLPRGDEAPGKDEIDYRSGQEMIVRTFTGFSADFGEFATHSFKNRWVEAENRSGKRQGAFCTGLPGFKQTRVFMTYTNSFDNVSTLAHELGHAYHSWVLRNEPPFLQDYPMNLAETASTFAEGVLADERLKTAGSRGEKLSILDHMLSDAVAFCMNIHARFIFENNFHVERAKGELTAARLSEIMLAAQKEAYLDGLASDGWYPDFWISKLHFYITGLPFYNYPYTFGYLLSNGLLALAREGHADFATRYKQLLIATGCRTAEQAVSETFGYDLREPAFWHKSLDVIDERVKQFLQLTAN